jgi:hypothetical protein
MPKHRGERSNDQKPPVLIPLRRVYWTLGLVAFGSIVVSAIHAVWPGRFDLISVIVAEIAVVSLLLLVVSKVSVAWGDKSATIEPAPVEKSFANLSPLLNDVEPSQPSNTAPSSPRRGQGEETAALVKQTAHASDERNSAALRDSQRVLNADDSTVLVRLRAELEKSVRRIATSFGLNPTPTIPLLLSDLEARGALTKDEISGIRGLIELGNAQLHGSEVTPAVAEYSREKGQQLVLALNELPNRLREEVMNEVSLRAPASVAHVLPGNGIDIVADDVGIQVTLSDAPLQMSVALIKLRKAIDSGAIKGGIVILATYRKVPAISEEKTDGKRESGSENLGLAWKTGNGFEGDEIAKSLLPWLFHLKRM